MTSRIQVGIRLRPFLDSEVHKGYKNSRVRVDKVSGKIAVASSHGIGLNSAFESNRVFEFDHIFEQSSAQEDIYKNTDIASMVSRVIEGFHSTIFAYGQTGSGKTFTMEGKHEGDTYESEESKGIVARSLDELFIKIAKLKATNNKSYSITCSFLQIYNERIYDLLNTPAVSIVSPDGAVSTAGGLKLRWNAREQFQVENLFIFDVKSAKEAQAYFLAGVKNRITAAHKLNMASSRSHTIFTVTLHTFSAEGAHETSSKMQLVDLAGSERIALTGTEGKMAKESIDINKSLFTLRQVITALSDLNQGGNNDFNLTGDQRSSSAANTTTSSHIPYRDSKLTSLLKQSIGGNCYCLMIACIVPNDAFVDDNVSTLHYATKATYIKNLPVRNEDPNKQILNQVTGENAQLKEELSKANAHIDFLTTALKQSEAKCEAMRMREEVAVSNGNEGEDKKEAASFSHTPPTQKTWKQPQGGNGNIISVNQSQESINERLIESITLVRQLLESNKELRQQTDETKQSMRQMESELSSLTIENQNLVDQLQASKKRKSSSQQQQQQQSNRKESSETSSETDSKENDNSILVPTTSQQEFNEYSREQLMQEILALRSGKSSQPKTIVTTTQLVFEKTLPKRSGQVQMSSVISPKFNQQFQQGQVLTQPRNPSSRILQSCQVVSTQGPARYGSFVSNKSRNRRANSLNQRSNVKSGNSSGVGVSQIFPFYQEEFPQITLGNETMKTSNSGNYNISTGRMSDGSTTFDFAEHGGQAVALAAAAAAAAATNGSDSFPTNFGRYTFYQQGFTHFDKRVNTLVSQNGQENQGHPMSAQSQKHDRRRNVDMDECEEDGGLAIQTVDVSIGGSQTKRVAKPVQGRSHSFTKPTKQVAVVAGAVKTPATLLIQHPATTATTATAVQGRSGVESFSPYLEDQQKSLDRSINRVRVIKEKTKPFNKPITIGSYN